MQLPSNATLEEKERYTYISGDVEKSKLYAELYDEIHGVGWIESSLNSSDDQSGGEDDD